MSPTLKDKKLIIVNQSRNINKGNVVVAFMDGREVVKRVSEKKRGQVFLIGDNKEESTDSRTHGWLVDTKIVGRVLWPRV